MGELLDRGYQRELLNDLKEIYPRQADLRRSYGEQSGNRLLVNLSYLAEHGLIELKTTTYQSGEIGLHFARVTAKGMDFIADDGGLSAILGVVTVKLHEDTIKALLIQKVQESDEPESVKSKLIDQIKSLPAEMTKAVTMEALKAGIAQTPNIASWLQTLFVP